MKSESEEESREYGIFSTTLVVAAVLAGIFLIWVGQLVVIVGDWEDNEAMKTAYKASMTLISLGGMISSGALIGGAVINKSIDKFVRLGMLIVAALITLQVMSLGVTYPWRYL